MIKIAKESFEKIKAESIKSLKPEFKNYSPEKSGVDTGTAKYLVGNAESFTSITDLDEFNKEKIKYKKSFDMAICILALQNIKDINKVMREIEKVTDKNSKIVFIINHPSFRVPQHSDWQYNEKKKVQERVVDRYMSESAIEMCMNPGEKNLKKKIYTYSFHRPLQYFVKSFTSHGFAVTRLEELISHKTSDNNAKRKEAEDKARKEMPMFMVLELKKL